MRCFTLHVGEEVTQGIRIKVAEGTDTTCPGILVGGNKGPFLPVEQAWFDRMVERDQRALELPELIVPPLTIMHADFYEEGHGVTQPTGKVEELSKCSLVSRPGGEKDRRALVYLAQTPGIRASYTGCYKIESAVRRKDSEYIKVVRNYPNLEDVIGVEMIAEANGEALFIMHPGAAFRIAMPKNHDPSFIMYRLTPTGARPNLIRLEPKDKAA
jgi:hypothetical protein